MRLCMLGLALPWFALAAHARGVSPYLPLNLAPEIERKIERVLILADIPTLKRPFAAATVLDALPRACERDAALCADVRRYLASLTRTAGIAHASLSVGAGSGPDTALPNRHGMGSRSNYEAAVGLYWQPRDRFAITAGAVAYDGEATPTGTVASLGLEQLQLDIGFRDRAWSPFADSVMLLGTQAPTMPSLTLSNYAPLTRVKFHYELFMARMSESSNILTATGTASGEPKLAGVQLSIEPLPGWSIGVGRIMQYGGGGRADSFSDLVDAFFNPSDKDNAGAATPVEFGNQIAALSTQWVLSEAFPVTVYLEYAGEDTSTLSNFRLGNTALSAGITLPNFGERFSATFELSEWQNGWYAHHIYQDGLRHEGHVIGHWGGDWRRVGDGVGARSLFARLGWDSRRGGSMETSYRQLRNEAYSGGNYSTGHHLEARYSRPWQQWSVGGELALGRDVFGDSYSRLAAFVRF